MAALPLAPPTHDSILGRRGCVKTRPNLISIPALWRSEQSSEPCLAFDVQWAVVPDSQHHFHGYSFRAKLTDKVQTGELALVVLPVYGVLTLAWIEERDYWLDGFTLRPIPAHGSRVLGRVVEEKEYLTEAQRAGRGTVEEPGNDCDRIRALEPLIESGLARALSAEGDNLGIVALTSIALIDSKGYQRARDAFREHDAEAEKMSPGDPPDVDGDFDNPLRDFGALMFQAGQLAQR